VSSRGFSAALWLAAVVLLSFLFLPVIAVFLRVPVGDLLDQLSSQVVREALVVTLKTNSIALAFILLFGTPTAYLIGTRAFRGRAFVLTLVELPLVLPPAVAGIGLLAAFAPTGLLGAQVELLGLDIAFTQTAVILAVAFVAGPFYVRPAIAAFEAVDPTLLDASRTLGASAARTFWRIAVPTALPGLVAGTALALGRALGEFGATLMFAGSFQGITQTVPLAIYDRFATDFTEALALSAVLVAVSAAILLAVKLVRGPDALGGAAR
jgi:molybdate transport system permease protein